MTPADQAVDMAAFRRPHTESHLTMSERTNPIAPYLGGKRNLAKRLCRIIDAHEHRTYAEPFVGMGGVFLRRSRRAPAEFINDLNRDVYNLFRMLQEHYVAFLDLLRFQITTQAGFERLRAVDPETLTDLQRAARFLYVQRLAFGGKVTGRSFGFSGERPARFDLSRLEPDLEALHERLSGVTVLCLGYAEFIQRVDRKKALLYLDPPYFGCEGDYGKEAFARADFERIADLLRELKGDFLLSVNDVPELRALFDWATIVPLTTTYTVSNSAAKTAGELIITNLDRSQIEVEP